MNLLSRVNQPKDLQKLTLPELNLLSAQIRHLLINTVSRTGGHLSSNLGVVELSLALHYVLNSPRDKIIWDTGHQAYTHKIVTGRRHQLKKLRQAQGLSGFPKRTESKHDFFGTGHASTSISAALAFAIARDQKKEDHEVVAVIGDGALTGGIAYEGLNNLGNLSTDVTVILNDNKMSISPNVGAVARHLQKLSMVRLEGQKPTNIQTIFENLNFKYLGPIDGHDLDQLIDTFSEIKKVHGPLLIHVLTKKGKGFQAAEKKSALFHSAPAFDRESGELIKKNGCPKSYTEIFSETLVELARKNPRLIGITAAMPAGVGLDKFSQLFPERFFDVGIAEAHAVTFAAGLAANGLKPFVAIYSTFLQRAFDQLIHDVALQKLPVAFFLDRAGLVGDDGPTHHGCFDLSYLRLIPNMTICAPCDENELRRLMKTAELFEDGPIAIRYPRGAGLGVHLDKDPRPLPIGRAEIIRSGRDITFLAIGSMVYPAMKAAENLSQYKLEVEVINVRYLKPLDRHILLNSLTKTKKALIIEENSCLGGLRGAVLELLSEENLLDQVKIADVNIPDEFIDQGDRQALANQLNLSANGIFQQALTLVDLPRANLRATAKSSFGKSRTRPL